MLFDTTVAGMEVPNTRSPLTRYLTHSRLTRYLTHSPLTRYLIQVVLSLGT